MTEHDDNRYITKESRALDALLKRIEYAENKKSREYRGQLSKVARISGRLPYSDPSAMFEAEELLSSTGMDFGNGYGNDSLTDGERAVVIALALYSSARRRTYSPNGESFGYVFGGMVGRGDVKNLEGIMRAITFDDELESLVYDLSRAIRRLGDNDKLDYAKLATDLTRFQNPEKRNSVINRWVKDYYRAMNKFGD